MSDPGHGVADLCGANATSKPPDDDLSDADLAAEYGYYAELSSAKDSREFKKKISDAVERLGFSEFTFVRLNGAEDSGELITVAREFIDAYYNAGLYEYDLGMLYAKNNVRPIFRSTISEYASTTPFDFGHKHCMREIDELNRSFGYYDFYNIPAKANNGDGLVLFSVTQRGLLPIDFKRKVRECYLDLELLCEAIDFVSTHKFADELIGEEKRQARSISINPRPLHVLDMLANNDMNITQVADALGINVVTANRHLQAARRAFGVKTNHAAIRQAILNKLIVYK